MMKSFRNMSGRLVSVLLAAVLIFSMCAVGVVSTSAVDSTTIKPAEGKRFFTVITQNEPSVYCYWWKNGGENGFVGEEAPKTKGELAFWNFSIPNDAVGAIIAKADHWDNDSDNADKKLTGDLAINAEMSDHLFMDLTKSEAFLTDFADTVLKVAEQSEPITVRLTENADLVGYDSFTLEGSLAPFASEIGVYEDNTKLAALHTGEVYNFAPEALGKHTISFAVEDALGNVAKADNTYVGYCKTDRNAVEFDGEVPAEITYGEPAGVLPVKNLTQNDVVTYSSSDESVIKVTQNSDVIPMALGTAEIIAKIAENDSYFETVGSYTVTVNKGNGNSAVSFVQEVDPEKPVEIEYGETYVNYVQYDSEKHPNASVTYKSDNTDCVTVSNDGTITGVGASDTPVTITAEVTGLEHLSDAVLSYQVLVKKADWVVPENIPQKKVTYKDDLTVDCSKIVKLPIQDYTAAYTILDKKPLENGDISNDAASIDENTGKLTVNRSGRFAVQMQVTSANYVDATLNFMVVVSRAERTDFNYNNENNQKTIFVGCSHDMTPPKPSYENVTYSIAESAKPFVKLEGNRLTALKENKDGITVVARVPKDDWYKDAHSEFTIYIEHFAPSETPVLLFEGTSIDDKKTQFVSDVTVKPNGAYTIALFDPDAANNTELVFKDQIVLSNNIENPSFVLKCESAEPGRAGAISADIKSDIYIDKTKPVGTISVTDAFQQTFDKLLEIITFGLYASNCTYEIAGQDNESQTYESGVADISYLIDDNPTEGVAKTAAELDAADNWVSYTEPFTVNDKATDDKQVIYARITDSFGNYSYICTDGIVYDTDNPEVRLTFSNNENKNGYFKDARELTIKVDEKNFEPSDDMFVITAKNAAGDDLQPPAVEWDEEKRIAKVKFEQDAAYTFEVTDKLRDFAGNEHKLTYADGTECPNQFIIDGTAPKVTVSYNTNDVKSEKYFNQARIATLTVEDDNFFGTDNMVDVTVSSADATTDAPVPAWNGNVGIIKFEKDGVYTFDKTDQFTDLAGNAAEMVFAEGTTACNEFVVDTVAPVVKLSYDNNTVHGEKSFSEARKATVTITEVNFEPAADMFIITYDSAAGNEGQSASASEATDITASEDESQLPVVEWDEEKRIATVTFKADGSYTFKASDKLCDLAGNKFSEVIKAEGTVCEEAFVIDTVAPEAIISYDNNNVKNERYFKANRTATITVTDSNFEGTEDMFAVTVKDADEGVSAPVVTWEGNVGTIIFDKDGAYTITPTDAFKDKADWKANISCDESTIKAPYSFVIDTQKPKVTVDIPEGYYFTDKVTANIAVDDKNFEAHEDMLTISTTHDSGEAALPVVSAQGKTFMVEFNGDADYEMRLTADFMDLAGNSFDVTGVQEVYSLCVDVSDPSVPKIEYTHSKDGLSGLFADIVNLFTGGIVCFPDEVTVTISSEDLQSGIKKIGYSANIESTADGLTEGIPYCEVENTGENAYAQTVTFKISPEFEGKIEATAYANSGRNTSVKDGHIEVSSLSPELSMRVINENKPNYYDGKNYYNEDIAVRLTVKDTFFDAVGKKAGATRTNLKITETTNGSSVDLDVKNLQWTKSETDNNTWTADVTMTQEGEKSISAHYVNNFGYESETKSITNMVLDKTAPVATISYDNNSAVNDTYYAAPRTATISVSDDNFEFTDTSFNLTDKETGEMIKLIATDINGNPLAAENAGIPTVFISENKQIATINFPGDAVYKIEMPDFSDKAKNSAIVKDEDVQNPYKFCVDNSKPEELKITYTDKDSITKTGEELAQLFLGDWIHFPNYVTVNISAKDPHSGINRIKYVAPIDPNADEAGLSEGIPETVVDNAKEKKDLSCSFKIPAEYKGTVEAIAYNNANLELASNERGIIVNEANPEIKLEVINKNAPNTVNQVSYYKENVCVRITITDVFFDKEGSVKNKTRNNLVIVESTNGSENTLDYESVEWNREPNTNNYYADFVLSDEGKKELTVDYVNSVGKSDNKVLKNFVIDKTQPKVLVEFNNNNAKNGFYFNSSRKATVTVEDSYFSGKIPMLTITQSDKNGTVNQSDYKYQWNATGKKAEIEFTNDAYYTFNFAESFEDFAGNKPSVTYANGTVAPNTFVVDTKAPNNLEISVSEIDTNNVVYVKKLGESNPQTPKDSKHEVAVSLSANDELMRASDLKLEYEMQISDSVVDRTAYLSPIHMTPDRHFVVTVYAEDKAGNAVKMVSDRITLDKTAPEIDGVSPEIKLNVRSNQPKIAKNGNVLYNGDVVLDYSITDPIVNNSCSGLNLNALNYTVYSNGQETQKGVLNDEVQSFDGRVRKMQGSITVNSQLNNSNNVEVVIEAEDNAKNPAKDSARLRIDITAPTIEVSYNNNTPDTQYTEYFNENRVATIQIQERNFNEDKVEFILTKDGSSYTPLVSAWTHSGTADTDNYVHTATITFDNDGDYTFDMRYTDEASNSAGAVSYGNSVSPTKFTVDKTDPVISVSFGTEEAPFNGNYFRHSRTATVTIVEHNFDQSRVDIPITANENGEAVTAPNPSWSDGGTDTHVATIAFNTDAHYSFNVSARDMSGREANKTETFDFYVDQTKPVVKLKGVNNRSANKDEIIGFEIEATDHHLDFASDKCKVKLERVDLNAKQNDVSDAVAVTQGTNQIRFESKNLPEDGIYKFTCYVVDMANNVVETKEVYDQNDKAVGTDDILFSVNRYGSTFLVAEQTKKDIKSGYVQHLAHPVDIIEINPDVVEEFAVSLSVNGSQPAVLNQDRYTRTQQESEEAEWKEYLYSVNQSNFAEEAAYSLHIVSTDKANNESYSDTANPSYSKSQEPATVEFVVDRKIPEVVVNNLERGGHYNVETKTVEIIANDDNLLQNVNITLNGKKVADYDEEALEENSGRIELEIGSSESLQNLQIEAIDAALNSTNDTEETTVKFEEFLITTNLFVQYINNPMLVIVTIAGALLIAGAIVFLVLRKKKKSAK